MDELEDAAECLNAYGFVSFLDNRALGPTLCVAKRKVLRQGIEFYEPALFQVFRSFQGVWAVQLPIVPSMEIHIGELDVAIAYVMKFLELSDEEVHSATLQAVRRNRTTISKASQ